MELYNKIKAELLTQRKMYMKNKDSVHGDKVKLLTTLIGDLDKIMKDSGEDLTDVVTIAKIKAFLKSIEETLSVGNGVMTSVLLEKQVLMSFLPTQLDESTLREEIKIIVEEVGAESMKDMGKVMGALKSKFDGQFDGSLASKIVKDLL